MTAQKSILSKSALPTAGKKTLHIYCRVSTTKQVERGHSLETQRKAGIAKAQSLGMNYELHVEPGRSAAKEDLENRPVLKALMLKCGLGEVTDIFFLVFDRLIRNDVVMFSIKRVLIHHHIIIHTPNQRIDLTDLNQEFIADIATLVAKKENAERALRSKMGLREAVLKGKWIGIMCPYGYRKSSTGAIEVDPLEAKVYKKIISLCLGGNGTNTIARKLNEWETPTRGKKVLLNGTKVKNKYTGTVRNITNEEFVWRPNTVCCILKNPIYKGERRFKGETIKSPAIIDTKTWDSIQQQLKRNKHYSQNHRQKHFYLLKGLLRCGRCGRNLYGKIKTDERNYMCLSKRDHSCGLRSVNLDVLNKAVWEIITNHKLQINILREELSSRNTQSHIADLKDNIVNMQKQIADIDSRRNRLIILFEKGSIDDLKFDERNAELNAESERLQKVLGEGENEFLILSEKIKISEVLNTDAELLRAVNAWDDGQKMAYLNKKVKNIVVNWDEKSWTHFIDIAFDAGVDITESKAIKAAYPPLISKNRHTKVVRPKVLFKPLYGKVNRGAKERVTTPHPK